MGDQPENLGTPPATASGTTGVPLAIDRATLQTELDKRRFREKTQTSEGDVIAAMLTGTPTVLLRGRTKVRTNGALSISSTTAPALPPIQWSSEDGTSTFNENERSTLIARDALGELDRAAQNSQTLWLAHRRRSGTRPVAVTSRAARLSCSSPTTSAISTRRSESVPATRWPFPASRVLWTATNRAASGAVISSQTARSWPTSDLAAGLPRADRPHRQHSGRAAGALCAHPYRGPRSASLTQTAITS